MSGGHGPEHGSSKSSSVPTHSTTKGAAGGMAGMFEFMLTGIFDGGSGGDEHDHGHH